MKYLIASDIHGSALCCEKLLKAFKAEQADKIILLGDILYHGPRNDLPEGYNPKEVIAMLNPLKSKILAVRGNCDCEVDQMVLEFPILADYAVLSAGEALIYITHGHKFNSENLPPINENDILLHGHTHIPVIEKYSTHTYINPGSVSIPKENSPKSYMTFDGKTFLWKTLEGEIYKTFELK